MRIMTVKPIPDGYHSITPYLIVDGGDRAIEFYKAAFGATELLRMASPEGKILHAELRIGDSLIMLADEAPSHNALAPRSVGGTPVSLMLYLEGVDAVVEHAVGLGATLERPVADQFYGDRSGGIVDPFGHRWYIATHVEDVSEEEVQRRAAA